MPVSSRTSRTAAACGFSPASTKPLGSANRARLRRRRIDAGFVAGWGVSFCGSLFCGSIRATCQTPEICRSTTPPAEISRDMVFPLYRTRAALVAAAAEIRSAFFGGGGPSLHERRLLLDSLPGSFHVASLCVGLANAEAKGEFAIELGMGEVEVAAAIQPVHQLLIRRISRAQPEADEVEVGGRGEFEALISAHPGGELLRQADVLANMVLQ